MFMFLLPLINTQALVKMIVLDDTKARMHDELFATMDRILTEKLHEDIQ
jgi:hypothetical protein